MKKTDALRKFTILALAALLTLGLTRPAAASDFEVKGDVELYYKGAKVEGATVVDAFVANENGEVLLWAAAVVLGLGFCAYGYRLWRNYSDALARKTFRFSLIHLSLLFAALLADHYIF